MTTEQTQTATDGYLVPGVPVVGASVYFPTCTICHEREGRLSTGVCDNCRQKQYYYKNRETILAKLKGKPQPYKGKMTASVRFSRAKWIAKDRGIEWKLTRSAYETLIQVPCTYCNGFFPPTATNIGLDRIDNAKGYEPSNVLPCCGTCNTTRNDNFTVEETKAMIATVIELRKKAQ